MKVNAKWSLGQFDVSLTVDASSEAVQKALLEAGLLRLGQGVNDVDKALGGFEFVKGKEMRKEGWKRGEVPYSAEAAEKVKATLLSLKANGLTIPAEVEVGPKVGGSVASLYKDAISVVSRHESKGDLEDWLAAKMGYEGETHGSDGEYAVAMLVAVRKYIIDNL